MNPAVERHNYSQQVVDRAANFIRSKVKEGVIEVALKSSRTDMVTQVDRATETLIKEAILERFPDDSIQGEEYGEIEGTTNYQWVVDPIDGTTNFVYGFAGYAVSIGIYDREQSRTISGCVLDVPRDNLYSAVDSQGALKNGTSISVNQTSKLSEALLATGFSYSDEIRKIQGRIINENITKIRDIRRAGAASLDLAMVASGEVDGYYEMGLQRWDYIAGAFIVEQAGGVVTGGSNKSPSYDLVIAGCKELVGQLEAMVNLEYYR